MSVLSAPHFYDEEAAFAFLEGVLWPNGPVCAHCGGMDRIGKIKANPEKRVRFGLHKCHDCGKQFTVKVGTVFEHARIPLFKMLQAVHLLCSSKKGISAHQLHRVLEVQYKTAWFLAHRIREAMRSGELAPMGGGGEVVEVDETYIGRQEGVEIGRGGHHKNAVLSLVQRGGEVRSFHVEGARASEIGPVVRANLAREAKMMTDESSVYTVMGREFASHHTVSHADKEYVRHTNVRTFPKGERFVVHTNTIEGYFSIFKRGMKGVYQHCAEKHLHRYLAEFDFRYNNRVALEIDDTMRAAKALKGIEGKRLTYRRIGR